MPCHPARARELLKQGKAAVYRRQPFSIILKERAGGDTQPLELKIDPGSKQTGMAIVIEGKRGRRVVWAAVLTHRGQAIKNAINKRRAIRRSRRARHTRYRQPRFLNRKRKAGWLPPSLNSRVDNLLAWAEKITRSCPVTSIAQELVRFDMLLMQNSEITGVEYQQGELQGYEVRQYLLEKWQRTCAYCGKKDCPLEIEHILPRSRGGSNRVSNLTLACHECNQAKGTQTAAEFGHPHLHTQAKMPLKDAAAVNTARWALHERLSAGWRPVQVGTGGQTKFNRIRQGYPKEHWIDAACVGASGERVYIDPRHRPLWIEATGRGSRQMCRMDKFGFPRTSAKAAKRVHGFQTGDLVKAVVRQGKKRGTYVGRVAVHTSGSFNVTTEQGTVQGIGYRSYRLIQHTDGYAYYTKQKGDGVSSPALKRGVSTPENR